MKVEKRAPPYGGLVQQRIYTVGRALGLGHIQRKKPGYSKTYIGELI